MREWFSDLKGWFGAIKSGLDAFQLGLKKAWEWLLNHVYALVLPLVAAVKSVWDFFCTLGDRIQDKLQSFDLQSIRADDGLFASGMDVLAFINTFLPLDELFAWCVALMLFWGVCLLIRTIKGVKQTVAF